MEREIKFRAFNGEHMSENSTLYDLYLQDGEFHFVDDENDISKECPEGEGIEVMQYTGLKDKNGKEIYEGDILTDHSKRPTSIGEVNGEIIFFEDYGGYAIAIYSDEYTERYIHRLDSAVAKEYEVIGNIYENPNLILDNK